MLPFTTGSHLPHLQHENMPNFYDKWLTYYCHRCSENKQKYRLKSMREGKCDFTRGPLPDKKWKKWVTDYKFKSSFLSLNTKLCIDTAQSSWAGWHCTRPLTCNSDIWRLGTFSFSFLLNSPVLKYIANYLRKEQKNSKLKTA